MTFSTPNHGNTFFGVSKGLPYKEWSWTDTGHIIRGPDFIRRLSRTFDSFAMRV